MITFRPHNLSTLLAVLAAALFFSGSAARAFSIDPQSGSNPDGSAKYVDPDEEMTNFASGKNAFKLGGGLFNFDFRPFFDANQRNPYDPQGYPQYRAMPDH